MNFVHICWNGQKAWQEEKMFCYQRDKKAWRDENKFCRQRGNICGVLGMATAGVDWGMTMACMGLGLFNKLTRQRPQK